MAVAGFPNLFLITGPGSPSVFTNMVTSVEQHVDWIADCLGWMRARGLARIEARPEAQRDWTAEVTAIGARTLLPTANSWYVGANVPGKPRVILPYLGGAAVYAAKCADVAANGYAGFALNARPPLP